MMFGGWNGKDDCWGQVADDWITQIQEHEDAGARLFNTLRERSESRAFDISVDDERRQLIQLLLYVDEYENELKGVIEVETTQEQLSEVPCYRCDKDFIPEHAMHRYCSDRCRTSPRFGRSKYYT